MVMAAIAGAYFAGGGKIPTVQAESGAAAVGVKSLPDEAGFSAVPPPKLVDDPDFALLKEGVESGIKALADSGKALGKRVDALEAGLSETGKDMESLKREIDGILKRTAAQEYVKPLGPMESERLSAAFSALPKKLQPKQYGMTAESAKVLVEGGGLRELMQAFAVLSAQGEKVVLCVGMSSGGPAPAWLEIEADGLTIVCKGLPMTAYTGLSDRASIPDSLRQPAYVLEYREYGLCMFGACEAYQSRTY